MNVIKSDSFGEVEMIQLGYSLIGPPFMSVFIYVETNRFKFTPVHTPGHSKDHFVFFENQCGWLFSGDLYLGERIKFFRSDEDFCNQITSLKKIIKLDFDTLFCAHNPCLQNGKQKIKNKLQFLEDLYGNIRKLAEKGYSQKAVIKALDPKKDRLAKWLTRGNVSFANMIRSALVPNSSH